MTVLMLRAEHDDFCIGVDLDVVPRWPIEEIIRFDSLLRPHCVGCGELATQYKAPVRTLAQIAFQSLE